MKKVSIGPYLRYYRDRRDLTQNDVAKVLNYSQQTIAKWENSHSTPDPDNLCKLADLYQVSLDDLLGHVVIKEAEMPYRTKKDVVEQWINSSDFKTTFQIKELSASQLQHLSNQLINFIDLITETINYTDSEQ